MAANEKILSVVAAKYSAVLPTYPVKETSAPYSAHCVPVVLDGRKLKADLLGEACGWLLASMSSDPFVTRPACSEDFLSEDHIRGPCRQL